MRPNHRRAWQPHPAAARMQSPATATPGCPSLNASGHLQCPLQANSLAAGRPMGPADSSSSDFCAVRSGAASLHAFTECPKNCSEHWFGLKDSHDFFCLLCLHTAHGHLTSPSARHLLNRKQMSQQLYRSLQQAADIFGADVFGVLRSLCKICCRLSDGPL